MVDSTSSKRRVKSFSRVAIATRVTHPSLHDMTHIKSLYFALETGINKSGFSRSQHGQDEGPDKGLLPDVVVYPQSTKEVSEVI